MTLNNIGKTIKALYQTLEKQVTLFVNSPVIRYRIKMIIKAVRDFFTGLMGRILIFFKSDGVKICVNASRNLVLDSAAAIKATTFQVFGSERYKQYLMLLRSTAGLLFEWIVKTAKQVFSHQTIDKIFSLTRSLFSRQTFDNIFSQTKIAFATIRKSTVEHKRLSAAVVVLFLVFLIWPGDQSDPPNQTTSTIPNKNSTENRSATLNKILPDFGKLVAGSPRKTAFFDYFSALINQENGSVIKSRKALLTWYQKSSDLADDEKNEVQTLATYYRIDDFDIESDEDWKELLARVNTVPASLALAQAANESAWGTSRFARKANNYYGQWCFQKGCGLVPIKRDKNKTHEVAAFKSPRESVEKYIHNLNSHNAYRTLRKIRNKLNIENKPTTGIQLAEGLLNYSERGQEYIEELQSMIKFNKLGRYD